MTNQLEFNIGDYILLNMWYVSLYICIKYQGWILGILIYVLVYVIIEFLLKKMFKL